jgi:uncharacterized protein YneF (UPF0154 family)
MRGAPPRICCIRAGLTPGLFFRRFFSRRALEKACSQNPALDPSVANAAEGI